MCTMCAVNKLFLPCLPPREWKLSTPFRPVFHSIALLLLTSTLASVFRNGEKQYNALPDLFTNASQESGSLGKSTLQTEIARPATQTSTTNLCFNEKS